MVIRKLLGGFSAGNWCGLDLLHALISVGRRREGLASLDEVMVALTTGELHLLDVRHAYCGLLEACCMPGGVGSAPGARVDRGANPLV
jgi:hypothetical protein